MIVARAATRRRRLAIGGALAITAIGAGCGADESSQESIRASLQALHAEMAAGRADDACAAIAPSARRQLSALTDGLACEAAVEALDQSAASGAVRPVPLEIEEVIRRGDDGTAVLGLFQNLHLARQDDRWAPREFFLLNESGASVASVSDALDIARAFSAGSPCGAIDASDPTLVRGGCTGTARGRRLVLDFRTAGGTWTLGNCAIALHTHIDARGHNWLVPTGLSGKFCQGVRPCARGGRPIAWEGQFHWTAPGQVHDHLEPCLQTPLGRLEGPITSMWRRERAGRWIVEGRLALIGDTASTIDLRLSAQLGDVQFRPRALDTNKP